MKNITKMLLSSAILATGAMAAENILLEAKQDINNKGVINIGPGMAIKVAAGKWITNTGTINFKKAPTGNETFKVLGTDSGTPSGIKNKALEFVQIDGIPTEETAQIDDANYYNIGGVAGTIQVQDPENPGDLRPFNPETDYTKEDGGTIVLEKCSLYNFLKDDNTDANKVIVLRGNADVTDNMILLNHNDAENENNKTAADAPLEVSNPFVNSDSYKTFQKDENEPVEFGKSYALGVNGFFKFTGTNTNFTNETVEFMDGSSQFTSPASMFGSQDITISGGEVNINMDSAEDAVELPQTINIRSHKVGENEAYGCLVITQGQCTLSENSVLNLGYKE